MVHMHMGKKVEKWNDLCSFVKIGIFWEYNRKNDN
jgi:hypothetical protein